MRLLFFYYMNSNWKLDPGYVCERGQKNLFEFHDLYTKNFLTFHRISISNPRGITFVS